MLKLFAQKYLSPIASRMSKFCFAISVHRTILLINSAFQKQNLAIHRTLSIH